jgi:glycosyltransferase involved in cell wall biosynthesis
MRRILIVAYHFPPTGGAGVQRIAKFVKFLPQFGYQPTVLTREAKYSYILDSSLMSDADRDLDCFRTKDFDLYGRLKKLQFHLRARRPSAHAPHDSQRPGKTSAHRKDVLEPIRSIASKSIRLVFIPDTAITWLPFAWHAGKKILKKQKYDVIFSSGPPFSSHIVGHALSRYFQGRWIADFRDGWVGTQSARDFPSKMHWKIHRRLEDMVIRKADILTTVSPGIKDMYARADQGRYAQKWHVITNGYDEIDFRSYQPQKSDTFRITYIGAFYGPRQPDSFLKAVNRISDDDFIRDAELNFIGWSAPLIQSSVSRFITKKININISGYMDHGKVIDELARSDALLLVIGKGGGETTYPGKLFEYFRSAKPILALARKSGITADLIRKTQTGIVVDSEDIEEIRMALETLYHDWKKDQLTIQPNWSEVQKFERKALTKRLVHIIENAP